MTEEEITPQVIKELPTWAQEVISAFCEAGCEVEMVWGNGESSAALQSRPSQGQQSSPKATAEKERTDK